MRLCTIEGCTRKHYGKGFCNKHYSANRTHGDPLVNNRFRRRSLNERFWEKVDKSGDCWVWTAYLNEAGYGEINPGGKSRPKRSHRVSWEMHNGPIPDGLHVLHKCDNPACVNPDHLFLGTHLENMQDMWAKGRGRCDGAGKKGSDNGNSKLTWDQVRAIRKLVSEGGKHRDVAEIYGVTHTLIGYIARNQIWKTTEQQTNETH